MSWAGFLTIGGGGVLRASDVRALLTGRLRGTPYLEGALEFLARAEDESEKETFLLEERGGGVLRGVAVYGWVGGAERTGRLHFVIAEAALPDAEGTGALMCRRAAELLVAAGARLVVAELPDDPATGWMLEAVRGAGWSEEGRVPDFYRDGVALLLLRRDLTGPISAVGDG